MIRVHIHEDDEGMRNVYPAAAFPEVVADIEAATKAAERSYVPEGGFTDLYMIKAPKLNFAEVGLTRPIATSALNAHLPQIDHFTVGYGEGDPFGYSEDAPDAFGFGNELYIKLDCESNVVNSIWFDAGGADQKQMSALREALIALDVAAPLMIADYWGNCAGLVTDPSFVSAYFEWLEKRP